MRIRRYAIGEEMALLAIFQSSVRGIAWRNYTLAQIEAWSPAKVTGELRKQWVDRIRSNQPWVAEVDGKLAAFADLQPSGHIDQFFVAAEFAGQGIGAALMRHLHEQAFSCGIVRLSAHVSLTAQSFFQSFGFDLEKEQRQVIRGIELRNAVMSKTLKAIESNK